MYYEEREGFNARVIILKLLFVVLFVALLLWLLPMVIKFPENTLGREDLNQALDPLYDQIFGENLDKMKEAAISYYTNPRLPQKVGDKVSMTLGQMLDKKLLIAFKNKNGESCDISASYVQVDKLDDEYQMKINLVCPDNSDYIIVHLGCYNYCENYICEKKTETKKTETKKTTTTVKYEYKYEKKFATQYSNWSAWSTPVKYSSKDNIQFGLVNNGLKEVAHAYEKTEQIGYQEKLKTTYDATKPITQDIWTQVGTLYTETCPGYTYFIEKVTTTTYTAYQTGSWIDKGVQYFTTPPKDTASTKYTYVKSDLNKCGDTCQSSPYMAFKVETRNTTTVASGSLETVENTLKGISGGGGCTVTSTPIMALTDIKILGYEVKKIERIQDPIYGPVKYYHFRTRTIVKAAYSSFKWSKSKNDTALIKDGYKYTGEYRKIK